MSIPWSEVFAFIRKESGPAALAVAAVTGALVFIPVLASLAPPDWRPFVLGTFLVSCVVALLRAIDWTTAKVTGLLKLRGEHRKFVKVVQNLPPEAKGLVRLLMKEEGLRLDVRDATVSLIQSMGLTHHSAVSYEGFWFDMTMQPDVRRLLSEHPEALEGAAEPKVILGHRRDEDDHW